MMRVMKLIGLGAAVVVLALAGGGKQQAGWAQKLETPFTWEGSFEGDNWVLAYYNYNEDGSWLCGELIGGKEVQVHWQGSYSALNRCSAQDEKGIPTNEAVVKGGIKTWTMRLYLANLFWTKYTQDQVIRNLSGSVSLKANKCTSIVALPDDKRYHTIFLAMNVSGGGRAKVYETGRINDYGFFVSTATNSSLVFVEQNRPLTVCAADKDIELSWTYQDIGWRSK